MHKVTLKSYSVEHITVYFTAARPKCSQCDVTNRTYSNSQFENCRTNPTQPRPCSSPLFEYCTTVSNNTGYVKVAIVIYSISNRAGRLCTLCLRKCAICAAH